MANSNKEWMDWIEATFLDLNELILVVEDRERVPRLEEHRDRCQEELTEFLSDFYERLESYPQ